MKAIYLDNHATTPLDPRVLEAMLPYLKEDFGNPASRQHLFGWKAQAAVDKARAQVARSIGAELEEIVFTSGATESNNLAILGVAEGAVKKGRHLITAATEHRAVLDPCLHLKEKGWELTILPVNAAGEVDLEELERAIRPDTVLISLMAANNEIGTLHPLSKIGKIARERGVLFHSDAAQAAGKVPIDVRTMQTDLLSLSSHKVYGPKGIGALYRRRSQPRFSIVPLFFGGGHEAGLRSGTLNVPAIVGMGEAFDIAAREINTEAPALEALRDRLLEKIRCGVKDAILNGPPAGRLPNNLHLSFPGVPADRLMMELRDLAISSGSACTTASPQPSHVLKAIGLSPDMAKSSVRFGLGRFNTSEEIDTAAAWIGEAVRRIRGGG